MNINNRTLATEVILLGFSTEPKTNIALFFFFFVIYLITCAGNVFIICIIIISPRLHKPMYYFLCNLAILDLSYSSTAVPRLLSDLLSVQRTISGLACGLQYYLGNFLGGAEFLLLALMAYDRYVAICRPLHYTTIMSWSLCYGFTVIVCVGSFLLSVLPSILMPAPFCNPNEVDHFMCDALALLQLSCESIFIYKVTIFFLSLFALLLPFIFVLTSYIYIISAIIKIDSRGRGKAFSTCSSHLTVVVLAYGTAMIIYISPTSTYSSNIEKYVSVVYVIITPMINPLIYSLKNREVLEIFNKLKQ